MKITRTRLPSNVTRIRNAATGDVVHARSNLSETCEEYMWRMHQLKKQDSEAYNAIQSHETS